MQHFTETGSMKDCSRSGQSEKSQI